MVRWESWIAAGTGVAMVGCVALSASPDGGGAGSLDGGATPGEPASQDPEWFAECSDLSENEIGAQVEIAECVTQSVHELIACGALTFKIAAAIIKIPIDLLVERKSGLPKEYQSLGNGRYQVETPDVTMDISFAAGADYAFGKKGASVEADLFKLSSYLKGANVKQNLSNPLNPRLEVSFDEPGPLVELFGFGATPSSPKTLKLGDVDNLAEEFGKLDVEGQIIVHDSCGDTVVSYTVDLAPTRVSKFIAGFDLGYTLSDLTASDDNHGQQAQQRDWTLAYKEHGTLDGAFVLEVRGEDLDYDATCTWQDASYAEIHYSCP